jgi:hypothetical protein
MQNLTKSYRGMSILMNLNWDRFLSVAVTVMSLYLGAYLALM